jgi:predicted HicB family RNase H-like nuclease
MKHEKHNLSEQVVLRVPPELRDRIETAAAQEGRSLANMARRILESWATDRRPPMEAQR